MKSLKYSGFVKALAVVMSAFMLLLSVASVLAFMVAVDYGLYAKSFEDVYSDLMSGVVQSEVADVYAAYKDGETIPTVSENVYYRMYHYGNTIETLTNYKDGEFDSLSNVHGAYHVLTEFHGYDEYEIEDVYVFDVYVMTEIDAENEISFVSDVVILLYSARYWLIFVMIVAVTLTILLYVFAVTSAGERRGSDTAVRSWFDHIPFDILLVLTLAVALAEAVLWDNASWYDSLVLIVLGAGYIFVDSMILTLLSMSFVVRIKTGTLIKNNLIAYVLKFVWRVITTVFDDFRRAVSVVMTAIGCMILGIPTFWRGFIFWCVGIPVLVAVTYLLSISAYHDEFFFLFIVIIWLAFIGLGVWRSWNLSRIKNGAKKIAEGDLEHKLSTDLMFYDYKKCAEYLNSINSGMAAAVEERMKGERFKTELITNVSHDIKTPITSIINYVDLLKKADIKDEEVRGYIEVLDRQSQRLKKLTGDLIEASKASSGVVEVNPENIELGIFLSQAAGEYEERLSAAGLTLVTSFPEGEVNVYADGKLMWRIIDNLMSNACKYSLPGTRVYLTLSVKGTDAVITLNNISREAINIDGDELTERFVRGDMSRHTEGSGLGLSIAKSLTEIQGGKLIIFTDSDLFKVTVRMKVKEWVKLEGFDGENKNEDESAE